MGLYMGGVSSFTSQVKEDVYDSLRDYLEGNDKYKLPEGVKTWRRDGMAGFTFTKYEIPEGVEVIPSAAFYRCPNLEEITVPSSVVSIEDSWLDNCPNIKTIYVKKPEGSFNAQYWAGDSNYEVSIVWLG